MSFSPKFSPLLPPPPSPSISKPHRTSRRLLLLTLATTILFSTLFSSLLLLNPHPPETNLLLHATTLAQHARGSPRTRPKTHPPPPPLPLCRHALLFSAARHGSTWLLDSLERCAYSRPDPSSVSRNRRYASHANRDTELWNPGQQGPLLNVSQQLAIDIATAHRTVKIFPIAAHHRSPDAVRAVLHGAVANRVPVLILRRNLQLTFASLVKAEGSGVWNSNSRGKGDGAEQDALLPHVAQAERFSYYSARIKSFFTTWEGELRAVGAKVDTFWYEAIKDKRYIIARENGCYVRNCNF